MTDDQRNEILTALATAKPTKYSTLPIAFSERLAIKKMLDENAALRAGLSKAHDDIQEYGTQIDEMDAENAALRRELQDSEATGYRRGIDAVAQHYQQQANDFRRQAKQTPDVNRAESLEYRAMRFERHVEEIRKKFLAAPDTEAGES